jgi:hypothetical protein
MNEQNSTLPTTQQLATLAATLARNSNDTPHGLVDAALEVWKAAEAALDAEARATDAHAASEAQAAALPMPERYPVTLDQFLRLLLPKLKGRTFDQFATYREYLRIMEAVRRKATARTNGEDPDNLQVEAFAPTKEEVDAMLAERRAKPFESELAYKDAAFGFAKWYSRRRTRQTSEAHRANALKRHSQPQKRKARPPREKLKEALLT